MGFISNIIGYPLGWIMWLIYQVVHNYAWAIVIFTVITKLILIPVSVKQQKSTAAMSLLNPKLEKLKKQYAKNQEKLQEEQMKLYNEEGINPMSSCLPLLIQLPILYGVFDVVYRPITHILRVNSEMIEGAKTIAADLFSTNKSFNARPEVYILQALKEKPELFSEYPELVEKAANFNDKLFGVVDFGSVPTIHPETWNTAAFILILIPVLSGVFQLILTFYTQAKQKKATEGAPSMAGLNAMLYIMPVFSVWIAFSFPIGIGFYWTVSSFFALIQQIFLSKIFTPEYVNQLLEKDRAKRKSKNKMGLMQRYQALVEAQNAQNGGGTATRNGEVYETTGSEVEVDPEVKLSKSKQKEYESMLIREARRRQAEKYGDEYTDDDED